MTEKESKNTKKGRGGARAGSGRKAGTTQKVSAVSILAEIAKYDIPFEQGFAQDYARARQGDDRALVQKYQQMLLNKVIADKTELDVTTAGESVKGSFTFIPVEMKEWRND